MGELYSSCVGVLYIWGGFIFRAAGLCLWCQREVKVHLYDAIGTTSKKMGPKVIVRCPDVTLWEPLAGEGFGGVRVGSWGRAQRVGEGPPDDGEVLLVQAAGAPPAAVGPAISQQSEFPNPKAGKITQNITLARKITSCYSSMT